MTLVAVSKFHPVEQLFEAYAAGQRIFGENRPQELAAKVPLMPADVRWHFLGHLQTNKLKLVLPHAELVHSVDSLRLLEAIDRWGAANGRIIDILLEVHISSDATKQGFSPDEVREVLCLKASSGGAMPSGTRGHPRPDHPKNREIFGDPGTLPFEGPAGSAGGRGREATVPEGIVPEETEFQAFRHVRVRGLMGMATLTENEKQIEGEFAALKALFDEIKAARPDLTAFDQLSMGMSGDWPIAVRHGATMVRIGTDIFGAREY